MVMQSKLAFYHTSVGEHRTLPFQLVLLVGASKREIPITRLATSPQEILDTIYEIEELVDLEIKVRTEEKEPLQIHWGNVADKDEDTNMHFVLDEERNTFSLFPNEKSKEDYPWRCGIYHFQVNYKDQMYYGGFKVTPRNIDEGQLEKIHEFINSHLEGLAVDYVNYKKTFSTLENLENSSHWQFIQWFQKNEQRLHQSLNMIENNSQKELKKIYLIENVPKHFDSKSTRWENTAKGQALKGNSFLNRKLILDSDSDSNRLVKFRMRELAAKIESTTDMVKDVRIEVESQLAEITEDVLNLKGQVEQIQLTSRVTSKDKTRMRNTLRTKEFEQEEVEKHVEQVKKIHEELLRSKKSLYSRISSAFWSKIGDRPPKKLQLEKYVGYQVFQQIWNQYNHSLPENNQKAFRLPVYRPTYELYEYYVLLGVLNVVEELGFAAVKDTVREQLMTTFFESGLLDNTMVTLQKDNMRMDVIYEGMVEYNDDAALENGTHFFSLETHRKPDIRIDLYLNDDDVWEYDSSFIIEVKYSPLYNIYNNYGKTKAMEQMLDYWGIMYADLKNERKIFKRNTIEYVICVYPGDEQAPIRRNTAPGIFLQYYPSEKSEHVFDIVGRNEMMDLIGDWLEHK